GVGEVVAAARRERLQLPVPLDEFEDRDMVIIGVLDMAAAGKGRHGNHGDARAIAEEIQDLDLAAVIIAAALIGGDEQRRARPELRMRLELGDEVAQEALEIG